MAKKKPVKKSRRRLKRSIRRSLAAVLMITAIAVAAIPVPENYAEEEVPEENLVPYADMVQEAQPYSYPSSLRSTVGTGSNDDLSFLRYAGSESDLAIAYIITTTDEPNVYQVNWQFKYFNVPGQGNIIQKYNGGYRRDNVELKDVIPGGYAVISEDDFKDYFAETSKSRQSSLKYSYEYDHNTSPTSVDYDFFDTYFEEDRNRYDAAYEKYLTDYAAWQERWGDQTETEDAQRDKPSEPDKITRTLNDLSDDKKYIFYCENAQNRRYKGYKLERVIDAEHSGKTNVYVYIPHVRGNDGLKPDAEPSTSSFKTDDYGFVYETDASIIGIGDEAFVDTYNVTSLTISGQIKYIGERAFQGCTYLEEITLGNVQHVCNEAFSGCSNLANVTFVEGTQSIGTECFLETGITSVTFPSSIQEIGPGAFAKCTSLQTVDFTAVSGNFSVDEYAFYNTTALGDVKMMKNDTETVAMTTLGKCAFACDVNSVMPGQWADFTFPTQSMSVATEESGSGLGDYVLAGRTNMRRVTMPAGLGAGTIPDGTLYGCYDLEYVRFPDMSSQTSYNSGKKEDGTVTGLFASITNTKFYVWGPELDRSSGTKATPRQCTWDAKTSRSDTVPYRYDIGDQQYYEISNGIYLMAVDNSGILTSCTRRDNTKVPELTDLVIWATVGETTVQGIASNCFSDDGLNQRIQSVTIEDGAQIATINDGVFQGWGALEKVYIGDSVNYIGANAFKDCINLVDVTFSERLKEEDYKTFDIGDDAFKTGSGELTFHGEIVQGYKPFVWAMDPDNIIDGKNMRVCYKSLLTHLTVMYNPITDMVTLLDYPKYNEIDSILGEYFADEMKDGGYSSYVDMRKAQMKAEYAGEGWDSRRQAFAQEWNRRLQTDGEDPTALYSNVYYYGPWIQDWFCDNWSEWIDGIPERASNDQNGNSLMDWLFEPIIAYADEVDPNKPVDYFKNFSIPSLVAANNPDAMPRYEETELINYTKDIVIPAGVQSIDVYGYVNNLTLDGTSTGRGDNTQNYGTYLNGNSWDDASTEMYTFKGALDEDGVEIRPGLFSGKYDDSPSGVSEKHKRGNDLIESVTMPTVEYLPDYAFDSCENLTWVVIGKDLIDIGTAPFRGCSSLVSVNADDNEKYDVDNGIIYQNNDDGTYALVECLATRGKNNQYFLPRYISADPASDGSDPDPKLRSVSTIGESAFEDCEDITGVDFGSNSTAGIKIIPEDCFKNANSLRTVVLPSTINEISKGAFVGANALGDLTFYGKEVQISARAFDNKKTTITSVHAYPDSAVVRYVKQYGDEYNLEYDSAHPLDEYWRVSFYDANYELAEGLKDKDNNDYENPQYVKNGTSLAKMPVGALLNTDDWTFERWVGMNNVQEGDAIYEDTAFYAQGYTTSGLVNGKYPVTFMDSIDGSQVGPTQYVDPGSDAIVPGTPTHAGYEFDKLSDDATNIQSPKTILFLYKVAATSSGGTNTPGTGSTGSTQTTSNTSNRSSSSSRNTSSSTSSSSTSTSSSGSDSTAAYSGMYTVTVINGSGSGNYAAGATVLIQANTPAAGQQFNRWTTESQGVSFMSVSTTPTTFTMPPNNVTITAEFTAASATPSSVGGSNNRGNTGSTGNTGNGSTRVDITKPGISNKDLATANVNGSTDNFVVKITETDEATNAVAEALTNRYGSLENILYYAMDISLYDSTGTTKISDTTGLTVDITIPIPDALVAYGGNNMAGAVINGNQLESLNESFTTINGVPCIRFTATHFSPYTIYVDTGNLTEGILDVTPKTGDPIHPKWFLSLGLACLSIILFMKKDKKVKVKTA